MIKFKAYVFFLTIFIGIGVVVYTGFRVWENGQKHDSPVPSEQSSIGEPTSKDALTSKGEKVSLEELTSKGEKVSMEEALLRIQQANTQMKKEADQLSNITEIYEHLKKGEILELVKHFQGAGQGRQTDPLGKGVQVEQAKPVEKDNTLAVQAQIDRLKAEQKERLRKGEMAKQTAQTD
jgi:predicted methyltransferase